MQYFPPLLLTPVAQQLAPRCPLLVCPLCPQAGFAGEVVDSDEEDPSQMDSAKGKSRYDFNTEEEWQKYKETREQMPKAAFQYGVKSADGRKSGKDVVSRVLGRVMGTWLRRAVVGVLTARDWARGSAPAQPACSPTPAAAPAAPAPALRPTSAPAAGLAAAPALQAEKARESKMNTQLNKIERILKDQGHEHTGAFKKPPTPRREADDPMLTPARTGKRQRI